MPTGTYVLYEIAFTLLVLWWKGQGVNIRY